MPWHRPLQVCPHCKKVCNAGNLGKWHLHGHCLLSDEEAPKKRSHANRHLNVPAIYIDLTTEEVTYAKSFAIAGRHLGVSTTHIFGRVLRGDKGSHHNKLVMTLQDFLEASESEIAEQLKVARQRRLRGYRPPLKVKDENPK